MYINIYIYILSVCKSMHADTYMYMDAKGLCVCVFVSVYICII